MKKAWDSQPFVTYVAIAFVRDIRGHRFRSGACTFRASIVVSSGRLAP
jgi:hypothetical protein